MSLPWYATREMVKTALDVKETARSNGQVDRALASASRSVDGLLHRVFYPTLGTRHKDWPDRSYPTSWRLWLDADEVAEVTTLESGGVEITAGQYLLYPDDGPPFNRIEINLDGPAAFGGGDTHQKDIAITGVFLGCPLVFQAAGTLTEALDVSETDVDVSNSAAVGVGDLLQVDDEWLVILEKTMLDTGRDLEVGGDLTASAGDVSVSVTNASDLHVGETLLVDSERLLVVDIAGNTVTVKRAWDGSVLATHVAGASLFAPRTLTVERGALGTTTATHLTAAAVERFVPPGTVTTLTIAEAMVTLAQEGAAYARTAGSGESAFEVSGRGIEQLRKAAYRELGRKARMRAV